MGHSEVTYGSRSKRLSESALGRGSIPSDWKPECMPATELTSTCPLSSRTERMVPPGIRL
jgi:hypothetical protein